MLLGAFVVLKSFFAFFAAKDPFDVMCQCGLLTYHDPKTKKNKNKNTTSPLLDPDDFSKCTEISFEAAEIAHAAYHAWNPDTELHRRWSNAFPLPTRLPSAPEDNPTPPGATQPTSDTLSLPSPNRALSAMRDVLTSDPPVPPPKRRHRQSKSPRKFLKLKGHRYR